MRQTRTLAGKRRRALMLAMEDTQIHLDFAHARRRFATKANLDGTERLQWDRRIDELNHELRQLTRELQREIAAA